MHAPLPPLLLWPLCWPLLLLRRLLMLLGSNSRSISSERKLGGEGGWFFLCFSSVVRPCWHGWNSFFFLFRSQESNIEFQVAAAHACVSRARVWAWDGLLRISWLQWHIVIATNYNRSKFIPNEERRKRRDRRITGDYRDLILMSSHTFLSSTLNISFPGRSPRLYYHDNARPFSSPPPPPPFFAIVFSPQVRTKTDNQVSEKKEEKWMEEERE